MCFFRTKIKHNTDLFLQTLTHGTVHVVTLAEELHDVVLRQKQNNAHVPLMCELGNRVAHEDAGSNLPQCDTASVE